MEETEANPPDNSRFIFQLRRESKPGAMGMGIAHDAGQYAVIATAP